MTARAPKGYKQTEVGVIPEEWEVKRIGDFTDCTAGGTPRTDIPRYWGGDIRWMSSGELHQKFVSEVEGRITEEGLRNSSTKIVPANCVLVGLAGQGKTRGTVAMNRIPLCTNQSIAAIFPNDNFVPEYLFYNLENRYLELRSLSTGDGGRGGLNLTIIRNIFVPFPPLPEQRAIAGALGDVDALLAALDLLIAKKRAVKQAVMHDLLTGKVRLPGFEGEWDESTLENVCEYIYKGEQINRDTLSSNGSYPVWNGGIEPSGFTEKWNTDAFTITISEGGNSCGFVNFVKQKFWLGGHCYALRPKFSIISKEFLFFALKFRESEIMSLRVGSGLPNIQHSRIRELVITFPSLPEQTAIAAVLSELDEELTALERERAKWHAIKQGIMNDLLTGKVRLVRGQSNCRGLQ